MLDMLYLGMFVIGILLTLWAIDKESVVFCLINVVWWLVLTAESLNVQSLRCILMCNNSTIQNITANYIQKPEYGLSALCLLFVFLNLIYALALQFDWRKKFP